MWGSVDFFEKNRVTTKALLAAVSEVMGLLKTDPRGMAQADQGRQSQAVARLRDTRDPQNIFELAPRNSMTFAGFEHGPV